MSDVMKIEYHPGKAIKDFLLDLGVGKTFSYRDLVERLPVGSYRSEGALSGALFRMKKAHAISIDRQDLDPKTNRAYNVYVVEASLAEYDPGRSIPGRKIKKPRRPTFSLSDKIEKSIEADPTTLSQRLLSLAADAERLENRPVNLTNVPTSDLMAEIQRRLK